MGGKVTCTLGEVKNRADFIVYWGGNPAECHPRHFTKYTLMQKSPFLPRGRKDRTMVLVDIRETKSVKASDVFLQVRPGKDFELITVLRAMIKDQPVSEAQVAETGLTLEQLQDFVARMKAAKYGVFFLRHGAVDDTWQAHELGCVTDTGCRDERVYKVCRHANARAW